MKTIYPIVLIFLFLPGILKAQIKNVLVEKYYVSDANDATDTTDGRILAEGSVTYRVYVVPAPAYKVKKIYGNADHALVISSTASFYNNIDRPSAYFGYLINKAWLPGNPTLSLDSWLTIGFASKTLAGVLKTEDTNGSIIGGVNNYGGTANIPGGILTNKDTAAGIPLTTSDGMMPDNTVYSQWIDNGFKDFNGIDTTIFGTVNSGKLFRSNNSYLQQNSGVSSILPGNKVLVAQLTTAGDLSFELNVELMDTLGNTVECVARNAKTGEVISPFLTYPLPCGCKDPRYLEYSNVYGCDNRDSCKTLIIFGCMDPDACNFNPRANVNLQDLCCYPGNCNDRDLSQVCPDLMKNLGLEQNLQLYPNPVKDHMAVRISSSVISELNFKVYDITGRVVMDKNISSNLVDGVAFDVDATNLKQGIYLISMNMGNIILKRKFIKE